MGEASATIARWADNPFFVLGVAPECSRAEAERAGEKLLGLLTLGASASKRYATPFGPRDRTPEAVRTALAELRDPARRLVHEIWARTSNEHEATPEKADPTVAPWAEAIRVAGWRES